MIGDLLFALLYFPVAMAGAVLGELGDWLFGRDRMRRWGMRP